MNTSTADALLRVRAAANHARRSLDLLNDELEQLDRLVEEATETARVMYGVEEVARALGVSRSTVIRRIGDGTMNSTLIGNRRLIPATEVERLGAAA